MIRAALLAAFLVLSWSAHASHAAPRSGYPWITTKPSPPPPSEVPADLEDDGESEGTDPAPGGVLQPAGTIVFHVTGDEETTYTKAVDDLYNVFHIEDLTIATYPLVSEGVVVGVDPQVAAGNVSSLDPTLVLDDPATANAITSFAYNMPVLYYDIEFDTGTYHGESTLTVSPATPWPTSLGPLPVDVCAVRPMTVPAGGEFGTLDFAGVYACGSVTAVATSDATKGMDPIKIELAFGALPGRTFTIRKQL
jgi:hypothetical protein